MTAEKLHDAIGLLPADLVAEADAKRTRKPRVLLWRRCAAAAACLLVVACGTMMLSWGLLPGANVKYNADAAPQVMTTGSGNTRGASDLPSDAGEAAPAAPAPAAANGPERSGDSAEAAPAGQAAAPNRALFSAVPLPEGVGSIAYVETPEEPNTTACLQAEAPEAVHLTGREALDAYLAQKPARFQSQALADACGHCDDAWFETHDLLLIYLPAVPVGTDVAVSAVTFQDGRLEVRVPDYAALDGSGGCTKWHIVLETGKDLLEDGTAVDLILT